jgi:hypothetical protein
MIRIGNELINEQDIRRAIFYPNGENIRGSDHPTLKIIWRGEKAENSYHNNEAIALWGALYRDISDILRETP